MKTVFIINPKAGQGECITEFITHIEGVISEAEADACTYVTEAVGDATVYVRNFCKKFGAARFIACGGDGTLSEVLNGTIGFEGAEVGVIPMGTGNDFCRNFLDENDFKDILKQITGKSVRCDAIKYETQVGDRVRRGYCVNMFNIGFDCNVADMTANMKKKPFVSGSFAYLISILFTLIKKKGENLKIELDGQIEYNGKLLLTSIANGSYCGGGIKSNPLASITDGLININIIKNLSRLRFISLLPHYMKGTVLGIKGIEKYITSKKCRKITVTPNGGNMKLCIDGEIVFAGKTQFEIVPEAFNFILPCRKDWAQKTIISQNKELTIV